MFDWVLNTPLLPVKNKERNYLISKGRMDGWIYFGATPQF